MIRPNLFGDLRAEADDAMLSRAFLETPDYRTLIETSDRVLVVGRRGTGKSALARALAKYWGTNNTPVVKLAPEEAQIIGVRPLAQLFGEKFTRVRAGTRLLWRYSLLMEASIALQPRRSFSDSEQFDVLRPHLIRWKSRGHTMPDRLRHLMREVVKVDSSPENRIGDLPVILDLTVVEDAILGACAGMDGFVVILIDKLDEGYEPDTTGVGLVDGLVQAVIDVKTRISSIRPVVFLRDNMLRALQTLDPDYSRNIEGHVLRLHWEELELFNFATARMKVALKINDASNQRIWNACTADDLTGREGFSKCLRLTLYRPRDILALLNQAFFVAQKQSHQKLTLAHIESTAQIISQNRLADLLKEYSSIIPGISNFVSLFQGRNPEREVGDITSEIERLLAKGSEDSLIQQDFLILGEAKSVIRGLYSVGFLGVKEPATGRFVFCHDGRAPDREFSVGDGVLVHPCYWMGLNCTKDHVEPNMADDIYDEYDIEISSETPDIRKQKIAMLIDQLEQIEEGIDGDEAFENWCHKAIRISFAKSLRNVALKPNKLARQRRDVVGTNLGEKGVWKRIRDDYGTRQVVFEVKNYKGITSADYQQVLSYLTGEYGRLAFVVTRDETVDLFANRDVEWVRDMYANHKVLIIKITGIYLRKLLYKLRSPQRHDDVDGAIHKLLDAYTRLYLAGQTAQAASRAKRQSRKKRRKQIARETALAVSAAGS
jgi:hypothetical protein